MCCCALNNTGMSVAIVFLCEIYDRYLLSFDSSLLWPSQLYVNDCDYVFKLKYVLYIYREVCLVFYIVNRKCYFLCDRDQPHCYTFEQTSSKHRHFEQGLTII